MRDVAERAQVSIGTVSRVVNGHPSVRAPVRAAVQAAIEELGYRPNAVARNLRSSRTQVLGLLVRGLLPVAARSIHAATEIAHRHGFDVLIADSHGESEQEVRHLQRLLERRVDGVACYPVRGRRALVDAASRAGVPLVLFGQAAPHADVVTAVVEEMPAMREAARDLVQLGHRRVGLVTSTAIQTQLRDEMLSRALLDEGLEVVPPLVVGVHEEAVQATDRLLNSAAAPTALIATTHGLAPFIIRGIRAAGLSLPQDLSLIAFGESDWTLAFEPQLSTIAADFVNHTRDAVELLIRHINCDESAPRLLTDQSKYTRRGSCGPALRPGLQS